MKKKSSGASRRKQEEKLDKQLSDSFPSSDPPSFSPGAVGAPKNRKSGAAGSEQPKVKSARKK
ncbi:MAG TPA: hypothetical protein VGI20_10100 [Rhizomicrobium sp.]